MESRTGHRGPRAGHGNRRRGRWPRVARDRGQGHQGNPDDDTREFKSVTILTKGEPERAKAAKPREDVEPLCVSPQDLYSYHARERIGRLLDEWLTRNCATPFELLHRADLIEKLDASGLELQHAVQKVAIPEAQARGVGVHEIIRNFQRLVQATIEQGAGRCAQGRAAQARQGGFRQDRRTPGRRAGAAIPAGRGGGALNRRLGANWRDKVNRLLDLADEAPTAPQARALAFHVLEEPLAEVLGGKAGLTELLGENLDLGGTLAAMTRLAAADSVEALVAIEPAVARVMPPLRDAAARLANWLDGPHFESVRAAIARRVLRELNGPRRLRPTDAESEIIVLRSLAMALTAAAGRLHSLEDVQTTFIERSKMLIRGDFVEAYLGNDRTAWARSRPCSGWPRTSPATPTNARPAAGSRPMSAP